MPTVAALSARLSLNSTAFTRGLSSAGRSTTLFGQVTRTAGGMVRGFVGHLTAAAGPILGFAALFRGLRVAESFQQEMNSSLAIVRGVSPQMRKEMESLAKELAFELKGSASDMAKGYYYLFSVGLDAKKAMEALPVTARFAQAAMSDLAGSTEILMDAMSALALDKDPEKFLQNLSGLADMVAMAATQANASITQFGEALTNKAAARMKMLNIPLAEGLSLLQAFASNAKKGAEGGTAFDIVMRDLTNAATTHAEAFHRANIAVFDSAGNLRALPDIIGDVEQAFAGLSAEAATVQMAKLGIPSKSGAFLAMVLGMSDKMREWAEANREAGGTLQEIADNQLPAFTDAWNKLKAVAEAFAIDKLTPWLEGLGNAVELLLTASKHYSTIAETANVVQKNTRGIVSDLEGMERLVGMVADAWHRVKLGAQMVKEIVLTIGWGLAEIGLIQSATGEDAALWFARAAEEAHEVGKAMAEEMPPSVKMQLEKLDRQTAAFRKAADEAARIDLQPGGTGVAAIEQFGRALSATEDQMRRAQRLAEEFATPLEKAQEAIADLNKLVEVGALDWETYGRARRAALEEYARATEPQGPPPAIRLGTREVIETLHRTQELQRNPLEGVEHLFPRPEKAPMQPVVSELEKLNAEVAIQGRQQEDQLDELRRMREALDGEDFEP